MQRTTFSITYYCRDSKKNKQGQAPLEMCININQERLFVNLPTKLSPKVFRKRRKPVEIEELLTQYRVKVSEINSSTMESKLIEGHFFAVEVIDVDAYTGGFNLQIAFSTGYLAGYYC